MAGTEIKYKSKRRSKAISQVILILTLSVIALTMLVPFWWMISTSFDKEALFRLPFPPRFLPKEFTLENYQLAFSNVPMLKYILNSFIVSFVTVGISLLSALMAGYAFSKLKFRFKNTLLVLALSTMMIPGEVTMTPRFFLFNKLGLTDSYWAFWLPALAYVFGTFFTKQYIDTLPGSLRESALLDGAGEIRIAFQIYLPLCGAMVATLAILLFQGAWNDFLWPLIILTSPEKYTLQLGVAMFTTNQGISQMPAIRMAMTTISIIPILLLYLFLQRYIVESIALSGIKQ